MTLWAFISQVFIILHHPPSLSPIGWQPRFLIILFWYVSHLLDFFFYYPVLLGFILFIILFLFLLFLLLCQIRLKRRLDIDYLLVLVFFFVLEVLFKVSVLSEALFNINHVVKFNSLQGN